MKKLQFLFSLMAVFIGLNVANAETMTPYSVDFDTQITTSSGFKVAPGWKHIVPSSGAATYGYITNTFYVAGGTGGSLQCQQGNGNDYLITPKVSGDITLEVQQSYYTSKIAFYQVDEDINGNLTVGEQIEFDGTLATSYTDSYGSNTWVTLSFNLPEATRVAIRAGINQTMYIDNFTATSAEIELAGELTINSIDEMKIGDKVISSSAGDYAYCDSENNLAPISFTVTVTNTGERELIAGEDNFSVSIVDYSNSKYVLATQPIEVNLAIGESTQVTVVANINYNTYPFGRHRMDVIENLTHTSIVGMWVETKPYISEFVFTLAENTAEIGSGTAVAFGKISETTTKSFAIRNSGAAPLQINSITVPEGYILNVTGPLTVPAASSQQLDITLPSTTFGYFAGNLVVSYKDADGQDASFELALSGTVLDPDKWYVKFDDGKFPAGTMNSGDWETASSTDYTPTAYYIQATTAKTDLNLFVTPLLHADLNEVLQFDVARRSTGTGEEYHLGVYYSTDRKNWTLIRDILNTELPTDKAGTGYYNSSYAFGTYAVEIPVEGNVYIGFSAGYVKLDNIYGLTLVPVNHDIVFDAKLPTQGQTNHDLTITATAQNLLAEAETDYTVKYYVNGNVAAEAEAVALPMGEEKAFSFTYTPYQAGTFVTKAVLELADGTKYESNEVSLTVTEEQPGGEIAVGNKGNNSPSYSYAPIDFYNFEQAKTSDILYTAAQLQAFGIGEGTKINAITFKGNASDAKSLGCSLTAWVGLSTGEITYNSPDKATMTQKVISDNLSVVKGENLLTIDLSDSPIVYDGTSDLRIYLEGGGKGTFVNLKFDYDTEYSNMQWSSSTTMKYNPLVYLTVEKAASTFSGTLAIENADQTVTPISGATVTLTNGNTKYFGTTDNEGKYNFNVIQDNKTYTITTDYTDKNYFPQTEEETTVTFAGTSVEKDITLVEAVDFYLNGYEAPDKGKVGVAYTATATVTNYNKTTMAAGDYTASLYVGNEVIPATEKVDIEELEEHTFTFNYTPTTDGIHTGYIKFAGPTRTVQTEEFNFAVEGVHNVTVTANLPTAGLVNHTIEATATVRNTLDTAEPAGSYTVKYYVDGEAVAETESVELPKNTNKSFSFSFMPHKTGSFTTYVEVAFNDGLGTYKSEEATLVVNEELPSKEKLVVEGTATTGGTSNGSAPINAYYKGTQSEMIYTAEQLGLTAGTKITSISFKGYATSSFYFPIKVWMANTEDATPVSTGTTAVSTDDMTKVADKSSMVFYGGSSTNLADLKIEFDTPFEYDGTNLRIFVESMYASMYSQNVYFSKNTNYNTQVAWRSHDSNVPDATFKNTLGLPAMSVGYQAAPSVFTGTLSIDLADNTNQKVGGATVTLTAEDGVSYSGETGPNGSYVIPVIQDNKTYAVTVSNLPTTLPEAFPLNKTIAFNGETVVEDITLTEAVGFYLFNLNVPASGIVNNELTVTIDVTNYGEAKAADSYTATLYIADQDEPEAVATAEAVAIGDGETKTFTFNATPYDAGTFPLYVEFELNGRTFKSETHDVTIEEENPGADVTVGTEKGNSTYVPFYYLYADNSVGGKSDFAYSPEHLAAYGIQKGSKIKAITFTGTVSNAKSYSSLTIKAYVGLQDSYQKGVWTGLTEIVIQENEPTNHASGSTVTTTITLPEPIVYDGTSYLHIGTLVNGKGTFSSVSYPVDTDYQNAVYGYGTGNPTSQATGVPVGIFTIDNSNTISGIVTSDGTTPMADVKVVAQSGNVIYKTYTDEEGKYELVVCQTDKTYTLTAEANGEEGAGYEEEGITFENGNVVRDIILGNAVLTLDEATAFEGTLPMGNQAEVLLKYAPKAGWNTIAVPFALTTDLLNEIFGSGFKAYELTNYDNGAMTFAVPTSFAAGIPYLVYAPNAVANEEGYSIENVVMEQTEGQTVSFDNGDVVFQATFAPINAPDMAGLYGIIPTTGQIMKGSATASLKGFRAYFDFSDHVNPANITFAFDDGTIITAIDDVKSAFGEKGAIYDMQGRKVADDGQNVRLPKGVYIQNGKAITVK